MSKKSRILYFTPLVFSFLFLFNPNIAIIDIFPDFIGYFILTIALYKISDLDDTLREAYTMFKRMIFIDAGKILAIFWIFGMSVPSERNTSVLLWTFVFSVIELICLIPAYQKLFGGLSNLGFLLPNISVISDTDKKGRIDRMKKLTVTFVIAKSVLSVLPEFADLTNTSYDETVSNGLMRLYDYIGLMRGLAFIPVIIIGIVWFICIVAFFASVTKDRVFMNALKEKYDTSVLPRVGLFVRRNFKLVTLFMILGAFLTIDLRIDSQNIIPDVLAAIAFIFAFVLFQKFNDVKPKNWIASAILYLSTALLSTISEFNFFAHYYYSAIIRSDEAMFAYTLVIVCSILKSLSFMFLMFCVYKAVKKKVYLHTGFVLGMERVGESETRLAQSLQNELIKGFKYVLVASALYSLSDICYSIFVPHFNFMGVINVIFFAFFIGMLIRALITIQNAIDTKYMLE